MPASVTGNIVAAVGFVAGKTRRLLLTMRSTCTQQSRINYEISDRAFENIIVDWARTGKFYSTN